MSKLVQILEYVAQDGSCPFSDWFDSLDAVPAARVNVYLERVINGNVSSVAPIGAGLSEIKLDFGPGYRIYFGKEGDYLLILLGGSSKKGQQKAIDRAKVMWQEHKTSKKLAVQKTRK